MSKQSQKEKLEVKEKTLEEKKLEQKEFLRLSIIAGLKHNEIVNSLEKRLVASSTDYDKIEKEHYYQYLNADIFGECDLHAIFYSDKNKYLLCFEVKATHDSLNKKRAMVQLYKDKHYYSKMFKPKRVFTFYVYGDSDQYVIKWISSKQLEVANKNYSKIVNLKNKLHEYDHAYK